MEFEKLKQNIIQGPILTFSNLWNPFEAERYASGYAIHVVLMQGGELVCSRYRNENCDSLHTTNDKEKNVLDYTIII